MRSWDYSRVQLPFLIAPRSRAADFFETRQVHHEALRSQQGNEALENLVTLCANNPMAVHVVEPDFDPNAPCGLPYHAVPLGRLTGLHNLWS
ncbi:MAG TPA: hypothetical protein VFM21_12415 [Terriglobia bacterium]|nr:hypothetical protein [Terriglobia bacterium]